MNFFLVGEKDEVSIKDVADSIVKAIDFQGDYSVSINSCDGRGKKIGRGRI